MDPPKAVLYFADTMRRNAGEHYFSFFSDAVRDGEGDASVVVEHTLRERGDSLRLSGDSRFSEEHASISPDGRSTARQMILYGLALVPVSLIPCLLGMSGRIYLVGALAAGLYFLYSGVRVAMERTAVRARFVLMVSVFYLPLIYGLMLLDRPL